MKLVKAKDTFAEAGAYMSGRDMNGNPHPLDLNKAEVLLNELLSYNHGNDILLYSMGTLHLAKGNFGQSIALLSQVTRSKPKFGEAWNNLGLAYKGVNLWEKAAYCIEQAAKLIPHADIPANLAGMYLNRGTPEKAVKAADEALAIDPNHLKAGWHKAVALLEMRKWDEAWDLHELRLQGVAENNIAVRNYHQVGLTTPWWDGKSPGLVVIHGEQGMGDEVMFASCIPDAIKTGAQFIFEPSPRMEGVFKRSFPEIAVYGTDDVDGGRWIDAYGVPNYKVALGSLPKFFRRSDDAFPGSPYLVPDKGKRAWWSDKLKALGPGLKIGIAWQGGVASTRVDARSFHPLNFAPLFAAAPDAHFISLQYDPTARECVADVKERLGVKIHHWPKAVEQFDPDTGKQNDLDDLCALVSKLDLVISVCQTAIHFAGALGVPCWCLTPSEPSWRYGVKGEDMPWYRSVKLIRQVGNDWAPVIGEVADRLQSFQRMKAQA